MKIISIMPRSGQRNQTHNQLCQTLTCHPLFSHSHWHKFQPHLCQSLTCHLSCWCKFPLFQTLSYHFPLFYLHQSLTYHPSFSHRCKFPLFHLQPSFSRQCKFQLFHLHQSLTYHLSFSHQHEFPLFQIRLRFQASQILLGHLRFRLKYKSTAVLLDFMSMPLYGWLNQVQQGFEDLISQAYKIFQEQITLIAIEAFIWQM